MKDKENLLALANKVAREPEHAAPAAPRRPTAMPRGAPPYKPHSAASTVPTTQILKFFFAVALLLAAGLFAAYTLIPSSSDPRQNEIAADGTPSTSSQNPNTDPNYFGGGGSDGNALFVMGIESTLATRLRPADFLDTLGAGQKVELKKISDVKLPPDGKPLVLYVVLYARLDDATERRWQESGLFKKDAANFSPFLRTLSIANREGLDNLLDWHVEGVLTKLPTPIP